MRQWTHSLLATSVLCVLAGSTAAEEVEVPEKARVHAMAWRANLQGLQHLICEYRAYRCTASSIEEAGAAEAQEVIEEGTLYVSGDRRLLKVRTPDSAVAWMQYRDVRIRCYGESESTYTGSAVVTSAGGIEWADRYESYYVPHRMMAMGTGLWSRVDYNILLDAPAGPPTRTVAIRVEEGKRWFGKLVDEVAVVDEASTPRGLMRWAYRYYFDHQTPGLLMGIAVSNLDEEPHRVSVLLSYEALPDGHWYPTLVVDGPAAPEKPSMYEVVKVTRLEPRDPSPDVFRLVLRGQFRLPELGHHAIVYLQEDTEVEADKLRQFAAGLAELVPTSVTGTTGAPLLPGVQPQPLRERKVALSGNMAIVVATAAGTVLLLWFLFLRRRRASNG